MKSYKSPPMARAGTNFAATSRWASFGFVCGSSRPCNSRGQSRHGALMLFGKKTAPGVLQVEHANHFSLVDKRDGQFGSRLRISLDIARILRDVGHEHRLLALCGGAH